MMSPHGRCGVVVDLVEGCNTLASLVAQPGPLALGRTLRSGSRGDLPPWARSVPPRGTLPRGSWPPSLDPVDPAGRGTFWCPQLSMRLVVRGRPRLRRARGVGARLRSGRSRRTRTTETALKSDPSPALHPRTPELSSVANPRPFRLTRPRPFLYNRTGPSDSPAWG